MDEAMPVILSETTEADGKIRVELLVPTNLSLFKGHFPGFPLLPGVAQIHWAARLGAERFGMNAHFSRMLNVKFQKPVRPGSNLTLRLGWDAARRQLAFDYTAKGINCASGKLEFTAAERTA